MTCKDSDVLAHGTGFCYAKYCPPQEKLAFPITVSGEADLPEIWVEPLPVVVQALESHATYLDAANNLPDLELWSV